MSASVGDSEIFCRAACFHLEQTRRRIVACMAEIVERSCDSEDQALRVQTARRSHISSFSRYLQVVEHYKHNCFDWTKPEFRVAEEYLHLFVNLCEEGIPVERIKGAIDDVSKQHGISRST